MEKRYAVIGSRLNPEDRHSQARRAKTNMSC